MCRWIGIFFFVRGWTGVKEPEDLRDSLTDGPPKVFHQDFSFFDLGGVHLAAHHRAKRHLVSQLLGHCQCKSRLEEEQNKIRHHEFCNKAVPVILNNNNNNSIANKWDIPTFPVPGGPANKTARPAIFLERIKSTMMPQACRVMRTTLNDHVVKSVNDTWEPLTIMRSGRYSEEDYH